MGALGIPFCAWLSKRDTSLTAWGGIMANVADVLECDTRWRPGNHLGTMVCLVVDASNASASQTLNFVSLLVSRNQIVTIPILLSHVPLNR